MTKKTVTIATFSASTDEEIIAAARAIVLTMPEGPERKRIGRGILSRRPDVRKAGGFLWDQLTRPVK